MTERTTRTEVGSLTPCVHRVVDRRVLTDDVVTLALQPVSAPLRAPHPGQFNMLTAFGVGEVAISVSGVVDQGAILEHTVRDVGAVTHALCTTEPGGVVGVRGPFGTDWGIDAAAGRDVVAVAGGIGLAPLRVAVQELVAARCGDAAGNGQAGVSVLIGARSPDQLIFGEDLRAWRDQGARVEVTVDVAGTDWDGRVGVVTSLIPAVSEDLRDAVALVCGPEVMMRFTARALLDRGMNPERLLVSLERNMQCGVGLCGHCQLGPLLLCRHGPVVPYTTTNAGLLTERER